MRLYLYFILPIQILQAHFQIESKLKKILSDPNNQHYKNNRTNTPHFIKHDTPKVDLEKNQKGYSTKKKKSNTKTFSHKPQRPLNTSLLIGR